MFPFERPIRDIVLKGFDDDPETFQSLNDKELFTTALHRYLQMDLQHRDMYRETLDDLWDAIVKRTQFSRFPPKHRSEGKYYTDYWRKRDDSLSRLELYQQRKVILLELRMNEIIMFPRRFWQPIIIKNEFNVKRLRALIAEFEDRCLQSVGSFLTTRLEYDEVKHQLIEQSPRGEIVRRDLKPGKLPEKFVVTLFHHASRSLTYDEIYTLMGIEDKKNRRIARWRNELKLDEEDLSRFFQWKSNDRVVFNPEYRYTTAKEE